MSTRDNLWAIILAAGEGMRLASLTERLYGEPLPKQFAVLDGDRSLLQATAERLSALVPPSRIVVVVPHAYEALARRQLAAFLGARVVAQPANRGTGPGILLPLAHVLALASDAHVVVAPSDHYVARPDRLTSAIASAAAHVEAAPLTLVGVEADRAETEYGWIEDGDVLRGPVRRIARFVEKPDAARARELLERGCLWNTFIMVAKAPRLWLIAEERMPTQAAVIKACVDQSGAKAASLVCAYDKMEGVNFSRAVLENANDLGVVRARGCGFSDWGTPERVVASLRGTPELERLLSRLAAGSPDTPLARISQSQERSATEQRERVTPVPCAVEDGHPESAMAVVHLNVSGTDVHPSHLGPGRGSWGLG